MPPEIVPGHPVIQDPPTPASIGGLTASAKHESTRASNRAEPLVAAVLDHDRRSPFLRR